jgi:predicted nucleic acid-binding protein
MAYLLDTGVLLRLVHRGDPLHVLVRSAVDTLIERGETLLTALQNIAEFYNVTTRPIEDNGFGLTAHDALVAVRAAIAPLNRILHENRRNFTELQRLLQVYGVQGKQVHDARLAATMLVWGVSHILTLNERHFQRFAPEGVVVATPRSIASIGI